MKMDVKPSNENICMLHVVNFPIIPQFNIVNS